MNHNNIENTLTTEHIFRPFTLYWNIPSFMCRQFKLPPINVTEKYGIVQNEDDAFR